jgi:hemerythrin-like domain-containing protein
MCHYCGCREFPLIGQLSDEHEQIAAIAARLRTAMVHGDGDPRALLTDLLAVLIPHTVREEHGLFAEIRAEGSLAAAVDDLSAEHDELYALLGGIDETAPDRQAVLAMLDLLRLHIDNEEYGLFPAAVIALPMDMWDRLTPQVANV